MKIFSFRWRLFLAFILVVAIGVGVVAYVISSSNSTKITASEGQDMFERIDRMKDLLLEQYEVNKDWTGIQPTVEQMAQLHELRILVVADNVIVADSEQVYTGQDYDPVVLRNEANSDSPEPGKPNAPMGIIFTVSKQEDNTINIEPSPFPPREQRPDGPSGPSGGPPPGPPPVRWEELRQTAIAELHKTINWAALWGGLLGIALAALVTLFTSRNMAASVRSIAGAARRLAGGDLSQRAVVKSKDEIGELADDFNYMAEELERTEKLRRNLVADIAHELRTPLSNVRGYIEGIHDGVVQVDDDSKKYLYEEVMLLSRLVEDLHELALAESGELNLSFQVTDIKELTSTTLKALQPQLAAKKLKTKLELPDTPVLSIIDRGRTGQVLRNLLINAINYTPDKGKIIIEIKQSSSEIEVSVTDTGIGIPPDELPYIFERFYRVDKSRTRSRGGTGLGLTIACRLIEAQGGSIKAESTLGKGSRFSFILPVFKQPQVNGGKLP